jgi:hypothetical protein
VVGRDLPNLCPYGEDHQGRKGARGVGVGRRSKNLGEIHVWRNLIATILIHKALD